MSLAQSFLNKPLTTTIASPILVPLAIGNYTKRKMLENNIRLPESVRKSIIGSVLQRFVDKPISTVLFAAPAIGAMTVNKTIEFTGDMTNKYLKVKSTCMLNFLRNIAESVKVAYYAQRQILVDTHTFFMKGSRNPVPDWTFDIEAELVDVSKLEKYSELIAPIYMGSDCKATIKEYVEQYHKNREVTPIKYSTFNIFSFRWKNVQKEWQVKQENERVAKDVKMKEDMYYEALMKVMLPIINSEQLQPNQGGRRIKRKSKNQTIKQSNNQANKKSNNKRKTRKSIIPFL
jgi:hypothetical protein